MVLAGRNILLGVTGSIAAYKAAVLVRLLVKEGADVRVVMTPPARQFITPLTMATLSKHPIMVDFFDPENGAWNSHVSLGEWADLYLIAPASANTIAKMAHGIADNLLMTTYLSARCPVAVAPAMDLDMYAHTATQQNIATLRERGVAVIEPAEGELASGLSGKGRMAEPEEIVAFLQDLPEYNKNLPESGETRKSGEKKNSDSEVDSDYYSHSGSSAGQCFSNGGQYTIRKNSFLRGCLDFATEGLSDSGRGLFSRGEGGIVVPTVSETREKSTGSESEKPRVANSKQPLNGKRIIVTAGGTVEAIDPVRYISNHSTGKMGYAIAAELSSRGAAVTLVSAPTSLPAPQGVERVDVVSATEMFDAVMKRFAEADGAVMCAAVADYTPAEPAHSKIKKGEGAMTLRLSPTRDIAAAAGEVKGDRVLAGFALETESSEAGNIDNDRFGESIDHESAIIESAGIANARSKMERKNLDFIVLNSLADKGAGFGGDTNRITILDRTGAIYHYPLESKSAAAARIADKIELYFNVSFAKLAKR